MRSIWILISSLAVVIVIGGGTYYLLPGRNPLLTASAGEFHMWVPFYPIRCGEILFEKNDPKAPHYSFCVREMRERVAVYGQKEISREDILDPRVQVHWREVMSDR